MPAEEETVEVDEFGDVADAAGEGDEDHSQEMDNVAEHLKDAMEGSVRLKRLLSRDDDEEGPTKKPKVHVFGEEETAMTEVILAKWGMVQDKCIRHVLEQLPLDELKEIGGTSYKPDIYNQWKSPVELLGRYVCEARERKLVDGGPADMLKAFIYRWKAPLTEGGLKTTEVDKKLRVLPHKNLRYVIENFDGTSSLDDVIEEADAYVVEDLNLTVAGLPEAPGAPTMNRFNRLELIDPLADACVFGDANLTFAIKLAKHRKALGHVGRVIATTFEELATLQERYKEIDESIAALKDDFAEVFHGVDCTRIAINPQFEGMEDKFGAVYYNFPHSGAVQGFFDGHPVVNWRHENLMRLFFRALRPFMKDGGIVKVASNAGAVGVRYSYILTSGIENEFVHTETVTFTEWILHRYGRAYGDRRDTYKRPDAKNNESYNAQQGNRDMVYCFRYAPTGEQLPPQRVRLPPTLKTLMECTDGPFKNSAGQGKINLAQQLYKRFTTEVSGTHVG